MRHASCVVRHASCVIARPTFSLVIARAKPEAIPKREIAKPVPSEAKESPGSEFASAQSASQPAASQPPRNDRRNAFTLVEVMLAVVILGMGLIGILRAFMVSVDALSAARYYIEAVSLAKEKMTQIELNELRNKGIPKGATKREALGIYEDFLWEETVEASEDEGLNIVKVAVFKKDNTRARRFELVSYVYDKE